MALLLAGPLLGDSYYTRLATRLLIYGMIALSLDLILGYGGMVSFGHAAFVGVGAYTAAILIHHGVGSALIGWPAAVLLSAVVALAIGALSLRTGGVYFIMITLAFAQMIYYVANGLERYGGEDGLRLKTRNTLAGIVDLESSAAFFYTVAVLFLISFFLCARLVGSHFGRVLRGIKDNERRMRAMGYDTYRYKLAAFTLAGALCGLGGALNANLLKHVSPALSHWVLSGDILVMIVIGGAGTLFGPVIGAAAFIALEEALSSLTRHWMVIFGPLLLLVVLFHRGGVYALMFPRRGGS